MRIKLKKFGEILISRPAGREAYLAMNAYILDNVDKDELIEIDFEGIKVMAPSWADEVLTKIADNYKNLKFLNVKNSSVKATLDILSKSLQSKAGIKIVD